MYKYGKFFLYIGKEGCTFSLLHSSLGALKYQIVFCILIIQFIFPNLLCYEISLLYRLLPEESSETGGWIDPWEASVFVDGPILKVRQLEYGQSESKFLWSMHFPLWIWLSYISHPLQHFMPGGHTSNSQFTLDASKENELFRATYNRRD